MGKYVYWFRELVDVSEAWAKSLNYGKLYVAGFPIPMGFVVAPGTKREIQKSVGVDDVSKISPTSVPEAIRKAIVDYYFKININYNYDVLNDSTKALVDFGRQANLVLVRAGSKAYPNIRGAGEVLEAVLKCLAMGSEPVVVQKMISPEKAGLVYTSKAGAVSVEATYGFASPISTKAVEPDVYSIPRAGGAVNKSRGAKRFALVTNPRSRAIEKVAVSREKQESYVLQQREIEVICRLASKLEEQSGRPQRATWGIDGRKVYLLDTEDYVDSGVSSYRASSTSYSSMSQPSFGFEKPSFEQPKPKSTSIFDAPTETVAPLGGLATPTRQETATTQRDSYGSTTSKESSSSGFGDWGGFGGEQASSSSTPSSQPSFSSPSSTSSSQSPFASQSGQPEASSPSQPSQSEASQPEAKSDNMFSDFAGAMNMFDSPAPKPAEPKSTSAYDPFKPSVPEPATPTHSTSDFSGFGASTPSTLGTSDPFSNESPSVAPVSDPFSSASSSYSAMAPKKGVIISSKESAQSLASQPTDAVLIKVDDINQGGYATPDNMARTIYDITAAVSGKETIVRLGDARANAGFAGARGVRRLGTQELETELTALSKIVAHRPDLKLAIPFVTSVEEVRNAKDALARHGLGSLSVGVVIETPAAVSIVDKLAEQASFVIIDVDHLAELMLAVDKSNTKLSHLYDVKHEAVYNAIGGVLKICKSKNVPVYVCGTATTHSDFKQFLTDKGADGIFEEAKDFNSQSGDFGSSVLGW